MEKNCTRCRKTKELDQFPLDKRYGTPRSWCKACCLKNLQHYTARVGRIGAKKFHRNATLRKYGLSQSQYDQMLKSQRGRCGICTKKFEGRICIDHSHDTGKVRGLLCVNCNAGIGQFKENPVLIRAAIAFLRKHQ
jgi:hypothetical protein